MKLIGKWVRCKVAPAILALALVLPALLALPMPGAESYAAKNDLKVYGATSNLVINGGGEWSAPNDTFYGWALLRSFGRPGFSKTDFTTFYRRVDDFIYPHGGSRMISMESARHYTDDIRYTHGLDLYNLNNRPALLPGGFTPATMPAGYNIKTTGIDDIDHDHEPAVMIMPAGRTANFSGAVDMSIFNGTGAEAIAFNAIEIAGDCLAQLVYGYNEPDRKNTKIIKEFRFTVADANTPGYTGLKISMDKAEFLYSEDEDERDEIPIKIAGVTASDIARKSEILIHPVKPNGDINYSLLLEGYQLYKEGGDVFITDLLEPGKYAAVLYREPKFPPGDRMILQQLIFTVVDAYNDDDDVVVVVDVDVDVDVEFSTFSVHDS